MWNALCPPMRYISWCWVFQFQTLPIQHYLWFHLVWFFPIRKGRVEYLNAQRCPLAPQLSLSAQTPSSFNIMPAMFPVALATLRPARPFTRSGYTATSVLAPKQLKEDSLRWCKEKRCMHALFRSPQLTITIAPHKPKKAFSNWCGGEICTAYIVWKPLVCI